MLDTILLAEDSLNDQELMIIALKKAHIATQLVIANDGEEALDYLLCRGKFASRPAGNPALILLDLKMPKLNGIEVLRVLRSTPEISRVRVVIITGSVMEEDLSNSYKFGIESFIIKPVEFEDLVRVAKDIKKICISNDS
ncbi:response regulator [Massilia varians]|uniref:Response regulator n=1 Tax=Massilia varians TaxID=457921 RepID=A0ABN6TGK4_9BURK|nr:response regulator [Massilia varians]BDT61317.1 response regulator [Massilia varians]